MKPPTLNRDVMLRPGEYAVGGADSQIWTLLGSCVSITLWHPRLRVGAMSHFLLAERPSTETAAETPPDARYGQDALHLMLDHLARLRVAASQCEAKIFGGGNMFPDHTPPGAVSVGRRNGEAARQLLLRRGIPVVSESLFGNGHRQIIFRPASGDVWVRQVRTGASDFAPFTGDLR
ncbi:MAG: chemotaxis protein CheD [Rhizobacter sp.]